MEQQKQRNQKTMHNMIKLQNQMQQVSSMVRREGEESMNNKILDRH